MATRPQEPEPWTRIAAQWFCFLGPPLAAFGEQQFSYVLVDPACHAHAPLLLQLPPLLALAITGVALGLCRRERQDPTFDGRFFGAIGFLMGGVAVVLILAQWLPTLFLNPCRH